MLAKREIINYHRRSNIWSTQRLIIMRCVRVVDKKKKDKRKDRTKVANGEERIRTGTEEATTIDCFTLSSHHNTMA